MSIVVCKLPKTGLGNQLFPLLKASLFAKLNNLPIKIIGYNQFKPGPYLRGYKSKRNYRGYFTFQKSVISELIDKVKIFYFGRYKIVEEPLINHSHEIGTGTLFLFNQLPSWSNYFYGLKNHRQLVIKLLFKWLSPDILMEYNNGISPVIGVHARMSDFRKLKEGEDFSKLGVVRTPTDYFIDMINGIRKIHGSDLPVSVFTDGYPEELEQLMTLNNINIIKGNRDIVDLLLLSKSNVIITSSGSTFSYWAGFLSNAVLIMHPDHIYQSIRPAEIQQYIFEGAFDTDNRLLVNNLKAIA